MGNWVEEIGNQLWGVAEAFGAEMRGQGLLSLLRPVAPFNRPSFLAPAVTVGALITFLMLSGVAVTALGALLTALLALYLLRVEVAPDRRAVVEGRVGVLAPDDQVGEAEVLAVDGVHHRFFRAAVEHLDIEAEEEDAVGHRLAARPPERGVAVALAESARRDERLVGPHAHVGVHVVALGLADEGVETRAGVVPGAEQRLEPVDERVLVRAMERVARLEGDHALPALGGEQPAHLARRQHVLPGLGEDALVGGLVHRAGERGEPAVTEAIDAREVGVGERDLGEARRLRPEALHLVRRDGQGDGLGEAAVGRDQIGHRGSFLWARRESAVGYGKRARGSTCARASLSS